MGIQVIHVPVGDWKKRYNLIKKPKRESIKTAQIIYPSIGKLLVKDADFAEAALIGHYSKTYLGGNK